MIRVLREGALGNLVLAGLAITVALAVWSAVSANNQIDTLETAKEALALDLVEVIREHSVTKKELKAALDNPQTQTVYKTIKERVPGPVEIREVIKWKTRIETREVPVETIREVFKLSQCAGLDDMVEYDGYIYGEIVKVSAKHGNIAVGGWANCYINDYEMVSEEFEWDATEAMTLAGVGSERGHRWWVGLDYALLKNERDIPLAQYIFDNTPNTITAQFSPTNIRVDAGRIWFPRKRWSIGTGWYVDADSTGPRVMLLR